MIRFTNYKRIYIILGVFVFLLVSLYVVSAVVKRSREGNEGVQNTSNTTSGGAGTNEDITNEKQYFQVCPDYHYNKLFYLGRKPNVFRDRN